MLVGFGQKMMKTRKPGWTLKGVNLALQWEARVLQIVTNSACTHQLMTDALTRKVWLTTKASSEMLIWRRLAMFAKTIKEYNFVVDVVLIRLAMNKAEALTRVPQQWLTSAWKGSEPLQQPCATITHRLDSLWIMSIHRQCGHSRIKQALYFARMVNPIVDKADDRMVVTRCEACQSIDIAPVQWKKGELGESNAWQRVGMGITHYSDNHVFTPVNCWPTRFAVWRLIAQQDSSSIIHRLSLIFFEWDALEEILSNNDPIFWSQPFKQFLQEWGWRVRLQCMYVPSGNSIAALSKLCPGNSGPFQRLRIGIISYPRTVCPQQSHLQMPFMGTKFQKRESMLYKYLRMRKSEDHMLWMILSG